MRRVRKPPSQEERADMLGVGGTEAQSDLDAYRKSRLGKL